MGAVVAAAALVGSVIGLLNAGFDRYYQKKANQETDPAWASYYGNIDSAADHLRKTVFESKWLNKWSGLIADSLDWVETICGVIDIADGISKIFKRSGISKLFKSKGSFDFSKFIHTITSKDGWSDIAKSLKYSWKGILFGDTGGVDGWKKRWYRAFKSKDTNVLKRISKIGNVVSKDLSKIKNLVKITDTLLSSLTDGFSYKTIYNPIKYIYSSSGHKGAISTGMDIADEIGG